MNKTGMKNQNDTAPAAPHGMNEEPPPEPRKPADLDLSKNRHYEVQSSIYSLLLSALNLSERYERLPGANER